MPKNPKTRTEIVNKIVEVAFGRGFYGNYVSLVTPKRSYKVKAGELDTIARKEWPFIPRLKEDYEVAGEFTSEDGSSLVVNPEHINGAERYAKNYMIRFKKNVFVNGKEFHFEDLPEELKKIEFNA